MMEIGRDGNGCAWTSGMASAIAPTVPSTTLQSFVATEPSCVLGRAPLPHARLYVASS
jgi:hypothetical protein